MREQIIAILEEYNPELVKDMDRDLLATDTLDSFDIVKLTVMFEDEFDFEMDIDEISPENFQTANAIVELVERLLEA